jgi:DNA-binding transcriptional LysR family regulator
MHTPRVPRLSLDLLRGFRLAARHLSFTRAARELSVSQPAISHEIRTLEEQLGTPLFRRVNRTLQLTHAGEELYRAVDEALGLIESATQRVSGRTCTLSVTTTVPLASLWLGPRLPDFARLHPQIDMRVAASNDLLDLGREHVDVAIRHVLHGAPPPQGERLFDHETFPVCAPTLARNCDRPLRNVEDLANHVLLDLETTVNGRPWHDWRHWFGAKSIRGIRAFGSLRFSHYDQVVEAAVKGSGVAVGKLPHLSRHLRQGLLVAPLGKEGVVKLGTFYIVVGESARRDAADAFVAWLHEQAAADGAGATATAGPEPATARKKAGTAPKARRR